MNTKFYNIDNTTNQILLNNKIIGNAWKDKSKVWGEILHKTCPYNAMFPVRLANHFIKNYSNEGDIVLDPFSGRGTTLLQSRILNRKGFASDLNPMSYVLSKSKEKNLEISLILNRIVEIEQEYESLKLKKTLFKEIKNLNTMKIYYSEKNLKQLIFLKKRIGEKWKENSDVDNFILSISLGLMHGPSKKDGSSSFFSLSMSNGISMSPNYVKKYAIKNKLIRPQTNIFELIKNKILKIYQKRFIELKNSLYNGKVKISNVLNISQTWKDLKPKLILTSPPYLNIINYTKQNWLKMWLLGFETDLDNKKIGLDDFHTDKTYLDNFLLKFMNECKKIMSNENDCKLIMVVGDVIKKSVSYSILNHKDYIEEKTGLFLEEVYTDKIQENRKLHSMGSRAGKAIQIERIYVFSRK